VKREWKSIPFLGGRENACEPIIVLYRGSANRRADNMEGVRS